MRKSANADISNLFRKFGGDSGNYKEIQQDYIGEQAQQSWPIVKAIEKERIDAPRLRKPPSGAPAATPQSAAPIANAGQPTAPMFQSPMFQPASPVAQVAPSGLSHHAAGANRPVFQKQAQAAESPARSLLGSLGAAAQPVQPEPAAPVRSLFGAMNGAAQPAPAAASGASIRSLFGSLGSGSNQPVQPAPAAPAAPSLFGALNKPVQSAPAAQAPSAAPVRSLFGGLAGSAPAQPSIQQVGRGSDATQLNQVFSRLSSSQIQETTSAPDNDLRSMLGFLKK